MNKSRELEQAENLYDEFKHIADNIEDHALHPDVQHRLSIISKKLKSFGDTFGTKGDFFKKMSVLKRNIEIKIEEENYFSQFR